MKKIFALLICLFTAIGLSAQSSSKDSEHLKFMGIPLTGTISQFHSKILAKGLKVSKYNNLIPAGGRAYTGTFLGQEAKIYVYYNTQTKIVYRAKAVYPDLSKEIAEQQYNSLKSKLIRKYPNYITFDDEGQEATSCDAFKPNEDVKLGRIDLFVTIKTPYLSLLSERSLSIDYWDEINTEKNELRELDEL